MRMDCLTRWYAAVNDALKPRRSNKHESSQGSDAGGDSSLSVDAFSMGGTGMPLLAYLLELGDCAISFTGQLKGDGSVEETCALPPSGR